MHSKSGKNASKVKEVRFYIILACALLVLVFCFQPIRVFGPSMENTLQDNDMLIMVRNWLVESYGCGDIVIVSKRQYHDGECIIKRIIAVEGQVVDIDPQTGAVYVDDEALDEPYVSSPTSIPDINMFPLTVEDDCFFVLGDNRSESVDSRYQEIGLIHRSEIKGKVLWLLFPGIDLDFSRIGSVD